jgi:hypothetical protein
MHEKMTQTQKLGDLRAIYYQLQPKQLVTESWRQFIIPNGRVTWFQGEACGGWHALVDDNTSYVPTSVSR